ncbi:MAG: YihY family inner membrane protein [Deltaproteobacteria bacterium]|nr:YihY family inner membrane protein [Deltaproteobacteria bacterium]TLN04075.1 MAG: YihY family inner membrane protein [bacterium]
MQQSGNGNEDFWGYLASRLEKAEAYVLGKRRRVFVRCLHVALLVVRNFVEHKSLLRASALSFTTILSIVPLLALAFAVLKGLGVQNSLEPLILQRFTVGSGEVVDRIITYINNTKMGSVGAIGLVFLVVTVVSLLGSIEEAFNEIWGVDENRSMYRRFSDYLSVVVSGPLLMLAAISITTSMQSQSVVLWILQRSYVGDLLILFFQVVPYLIVWIAFFSLYVFMPNTKVRLKSALFGGILAGTIWQLAQWGFIHFQVGVAKYNAIYGTLAALPVFMAWIFTSWVIVLFGVEVVVAHQSRKAFLHDHEPGNLSYATREAMALVILLTVAGSFYREERAWTLERLADERDVPLRTARKLLAKLVASGYLLIAEGKGTYYPARDLEHIRVSTLIRDLKHQGGEIPFAESDQLGEMTRELILKLDRLTEEAFADLSLKDLVERYELGRNDK